MFDSTTRELRNAPAGDCPMSRTLVMDTAHGLHARPAGLLVRCVLPFRCQVMAQCGDGLADVRSLLGLLGLAAGRHSKITFTATGQDAAQALAAIQRLFERRFDEGCEERGPASPGNAPGFNPSCP
jgi:phosphocarrier protein HPr